MKRFSLLTLLLAMFAMPILAQSSEEAVPTRVNLGVSYGLIFPDEKETNLPKILSCEANVATSEYLSWHLDVTSEFFFCNERFSLATGVRFVNHSAMVENGWDNFYWLVKESATTNDYISLNALGQRNFYVGIPLAMRVFFAPYQCRVRPYVKVDASFDFKVATNNTVSIVNSRMATLYERNVLEEIGKPDVFHPSISASGGIRIRCHHFYVNPEVVFPRFELGKSPISFIDMDEMRVGGGLKVSFQFPVGPSGEKVTKVESTYDNNIQTEKAMPTEDF